VDGRRQNSRPNAVCLSAYPFATRTYAPNSLSVTGSPSFWYSRSIAHTTRVVPIGQVRRLVLRQVARMTIIGGVIGILGALA
jgi:hypothetical protein